MITPSDLPGVDASLARRIIAVARSIAPCLDNLVDEAQLDAIAILAGVAGEAKGRANRGLKSQKIGTASVEYNVADWFSDEDTAGLRALCEAVSSAALGPIGQFPHASRAVDRMWPERY